MSLCSVWGQITFKGPFPRALHSFCLLPLSDLSFRRREKRLVNKRRLKQIQRSPAAAAQNQDSSTQGSRTGQHRASGCQAPSTGHQAPAPPGPAMQPGISACWENIRRAETMAPFTEVREQQAGSCSKTRAPRAGNESTGLLLFFFFFFPRS